jgi:hypothetical protein
MFGCIRGVSKKFGEWYQKTNKTEDTNKLTLFAFKIIAILHNILLAQAPDQGSVTCYDACDRQF